MNSEEVSRETELRKVFGKKLREARLTREMTQEELANLLGTTKQVISYYEIGKRSPTITTAVEYARILGISLDELYPDNAPDIPGHQTFAFIPGRSMVKVIGSVRCGPGGLAFEENLGEEMADVSNADEYFYLRAEGNSMEPDIKAGDLVLVHKQQEVENGALAVVVIGREEGTLKRIGYKHGAVVLTSINPAFPPRILIGEEINDMIVAGRVMKVVRNY